MMQDTQGDFYYNLVLFSFASQLYFYVLVLSSLLGYQYFTIRKQGYFCNKAIRGSYANKVKKAIAFKYGSYTRKNTKVKY